MSQLSNQSITFKSDRKIGMETLLLILLCGSVLLILGLLFQPIKTVLSAMVLVGGLCIIPLSVIYYTDITLDAINLRSRIMFFFARNTVPLKLIRRIEVDMARWNVSEVPSFVFHTGVGGNSKIYVYNISAYSKDVVGKILDELTRRNPAIVIDESARKYVNTL